MKLLDLSVGESKKRALSARMTSNEGVIELKKSNISLDKTV